MLMIAEVLSVDPVEGVCEVATESGFVLRDVSWPAGSRVPGTREMVAVSVTATSKKIVNLE